MTISKRGRMPHALRPELKGFDKFVVEDMCGYYRRDLYISFPNGFGAHISKDMTGKNPDKWIVMLIAFDNGMPCMLVKDDKPYVAACTKRQLRLRLDEIKHLVKRG